MRKPCLHIDEDTRLIFGSIASRLKKEGRPREHRIQDLWMAASAIQHGHKLLSRNVKDFKDIPGLDLVVCAE